MLFNLNNDPTESHDLAAEHPEQVNAAQELMARTRTVEPDFPLPVLDADH